jgi:hypothetical protein
MVYMPRKPNKILQIVKETLQLFYFILIIKKQKPPGMNNMYLLQSYLLHKRCLLCVNPIGWPWKGYMVEEIA